MKKLIIVAMALTLALSAAPAFAKGKKAEPAKVETKKVDAKKLEALEKAIAEFTHG